MFERLGTSAAPILTAAGTIDATASDGNIYVTNNQAGSFTATTTTAGSVTLSTSAGVLTIGGATNTAGGTITATSTGTGGGITVSAPLATAPPETSR